MGLKAFSVLHFYLRMPMINNVFHSPEQISWKLSVVWLRYLVPTKCVKLPKMLDEMRASEIDSHQSVKKKENSSNCRYVPVTKLLHLFKSSAKISRDLRFLHFVKNKIWMKWRRQKLTHIWFKHFKKCSKKYWQTGDLHILLDRKKCFIYRILNTNIWILNFEQ